MPQVHLITDAVGDGCKLWSDEAREECKRRAQEQHPKAKNFRFYQYQLGYKVHMHCWFDV